MNRIEMQKALDDVNDQGIYFHSFTDYMRDYEVIIVAISDPASGIPPAYLRYLFKNCVEANVVTALTPEIWKRSLDERLIDYKTGVDLKGYVWGVKWQLLYPGANIQEKSETTERWTKLLGFECYEVLFQTNGHNISLVFSDLAITEIERGYAPFVFLSGE